jgi:hypothetical protein
MLWNACDTGTGNGLRHMFEIFDTILQPVDFRFQCFNGLRHWELPLRVEMSERSRSLAFGGG